MIGEGTIAKLAIVPAGIYVVAEILPRVIQSGFETAALCAGGLAGIGYLVRLVRRAVKSSHDFTARVHKGIDVIEVVPGRLDKIDKRLDDGDRRMGEFERILSTFADADRDRVRDALAGDQRSPVDRRAA